MLPEIWLHNLWYFLQGACQIFFSQFQGFQGFFLNFSAVFQVFLVNFLPVFKVLLKNFIRSLLRDSETSERISISEDSQTQKMSDLLSFDTCKC